MTKSITIAVVADSHYGARSPVPTRRSEIADVLLARTVARLNRLVRPDVTLVLGDLIDDGNSPDAEGYLQRIRAILDNLTMPYIAVPGNHDSDPEMFYRVFERPADFEDIAGARFLPFVDRDEPGYNATRSDADIERIRAARAGFNGPLVSLQHVCLFPPHQDIAPYNYTNADDIIAAMKEAGVTLSISGHHHGGCENTRDGDVTFANVAGLCEAPFPFTVITIDNGQIQMQRHELTMPAHLQLVDNHVHTELAYCSQDVTVQKAIELFPDFGLAGITFAEHSGQLYFGKERYWNKTCLRKGIDAAVDAENRMPDYLDMKRTHENNEVRFGLEVDCDFGGNPVLKDHDSKHFNFYAGTIHALPSMSKDAPPTQADQDDFLSLLDKLLAGNIHVLAHPLRVFGRSGHPTPPELFRPVAELLHKHGVAAEINYHTNRPPVEFIRECLDLDVKFSFGSDAHHLAEIGDFAYHLSLLEDAGFDGDLSDILASWRTAP